MMRNLLLLLACGFVFFSCDEMMQSGGTTTNNQTPTPGPTTTKIKQTPNQPKTDDNFSEEDLNYKGKKVVLTKHARCRMDCRHIDPIEIQEVMDKGKINERKTNRSASPCPSIAYEGLTRDGQNTRIIVGDCTPAKIITVIDLDTDFECTCD